MKKHSRIIATDTHVGQDVPDSVAFPLLMERLKTRRRLTAKGCWEYTGYVLPNGYAQICFRGKNHRIHRLVYEIYRGPIPSGQVICHKCDNTICFNPKHLEPGTFKENTMQAVRRGRHHKSTRTHCPHGHSVVEYGVRHGREPYRHIHCRMCRLIRDRLKAGWSEAAAKTPPKERRPPINVYRGPFPSRPRVTHCKSGHEFTPENTRWSKRGEYKRRTCRACHRISVRKWGEKVTSVDAGVRQGD